MADRVIDILINFGVDAATAQNVQRELDGMTDRVDQLETSASRLMQTAGSLDEIFGRIGALGSTVFAPSLLSVNNYVNTVGRAEAGSRRWLVAQERLSRSQQEFGRQAAKVMTPYLEIVADISEKINAIDPRVLQVGITAGGLLAAVGAAGLLGTQVLRLIAATKELVAAIKLMQLSGGLTGALAGAALPLAGAGIGIGLGVPLGLEAVNQIGKVTDNQRLADYELKDLVKTYIEGIGLVAGLIVKALSESAKIFGEVRATLQHAAIDFRDQFDQFVLVLKQAILSFEKALLQIELLGVNLGEELGIDPREIAEKERQYDEQRATRHDRLDSAHEAVEQTLDTWLKDVDTWTEEVATRLTTVLDWFNLKLDELAGATEDSPATDLVSEFGQEALDAFDQFEQDLVAINEDRLERLRESHAGYLDDIKTMDAEFQSQQLKAEAQYRAQLEQMAKQYREQDQALRDDAAKATREADAEYLDSRAEITEVYHRQEKERLDQFRRDRKRADDQARLDLINAASSLDARSVLDILQTSAKNRKEAREDFDVETEKRSSEHTRELQDLDREHAELRQKRQIALRDQLEDLRKSYQAQREEARDQQRALQDELRIQHREALDARRTAYHKELQAIQSQAEKAREIRERAFKRDISALMGYQEFETSARRAHYIRLAADLDNFVRRHGLSPNSSTSTPIPGSVGELRQQPTTPRTHTIQRFSFGGYTREGLAHVEDDEYVLKPDTARALERQIGGRLTQHALLQLSHQSQSLGGVSITINESRTPAATGEAVRRELVQILKHMSRK